MVSLLEALIFLLSESCLPSPTQWTTLAIPATLPPTPTPVSFEHLPTLQSVQHHLGCPDVLLFFFFNF